MKMTEHKVAVYLVLCLFLTAVSSNTYMDYKKLYDDLQKKGDSRIRPILNQTHTLNVTVVAKLLKIQALEERMQLLFCTMVLEFSWTAETMQWNPASFGGIDKVHDKVHISPKNAWLPDIVYQNTISNLHEMKSSEKMMTTLYNNGTSVWASGSNLISYCSVDITHYPFDTQTCRVLIGKIYNYDTEMMIIPFSDSLNLDDYEENDEWILISHSIDYVKIKDQFHFVQFEVTIKRRPLFYLFNIVFPVILLSMMNVFSFKIPCSSGERISYCISMLLTFSVFLSTVSEYLPRVSLKISYIQLYISIQFAFCILITIFSALNLNYFEYGNRVPFWMYKLSTLFLKKKDNSIVQPYPNPGNMDNENHQTDNIHNTEEIMKREKVIAVRQMDNLCFWLFMICFLLSTLILFLLMIC